MTENKYKCGHKPSPVFLTNSLISYTEYENWRESTGFDGDSSECHTCYALRRKKETAEFIKVFT